MERYFIIVIEELNGENYIGGLQHDFEQLKQYQHLVLDNFKPSTTGAPVVFPLNTLSLEWAVCVGKTRSIFKGFGVHQLQELFSSSFVADLPFESWDAKSFNHLNNHAIDIILQWNDCSEFWKSFNPSNSVKLFCGDDVVEKEQVINPKMFWRGTMKMRDPENTSVYGQMENAELNYAFDKLDLLKNQIKNANPSVLLPSQQQQTRITFCPFLELVGAFNAQTVPFIFYSTPMSLTLSVESADSFWNTMDKNVSLLFRLDYAPDEVELWQKEMKGAQSIHFLSHWADGELKLFVLKNAEQLQILANVFVRSVEGSSQIAWAAPAKQVVSSYLKLDRMDEEIRRLQLLALQTWIAEKGSIDSTTLDQLMDQVALAVVTKHRSRFTINAPPPSAGGAECSAAADVFTDGDMLKWRLEKKMTTIEAERAAAAAASSRNLMQPTNGRIITVDVPQLLRCLNKKTTVGRSPKKVRVLDQPSVTTNLKPSCNEDTVRATSWPQSANLRYHGINYNLNVDDEKMEKQRAEYQDKWVPPDTASAAWCNPWSFGTSTTFQISTRSRQPTPLSAAAAATTTAATATTTEVRTPRKNAQQSRERLAHLRKSPRLLAKGATGRTTRRTPSKKNNASAATTTAPSAGTSKDTFKQQLKAVIIKVLSDQKIGTKDPLFRTCANKLSVICMALLKDSRTVVTPRQMYQVAKSQAKQVLQFVKP